MDTVVDIVKYDLSDAEFEEQRRRIEEEVAANRPVLFRKPKRSSGVLEHEVRAALAMADEAYKNGEWLDAAQVYLQMSEMKVGPLKIVAKLAFCGMMSGDLTVAYPNAKEAIQAMSVESDAYLAMAYMKLYLSIPTQAEKWLALARLASNRHDDLIAEVATEIELVKKLCA